jgi:uncharacterized protein YcfJ
MGTLFAKTGCYPRQGIAMNPIRQTCVRLALPATTALALASLGACGDMSTRDPNTEVGAGVGAAAGGVIGNQIKK